MAEGDDSASKTEDPTPKRLEEARAKGDVAKEKLAYKWAEFFVL